MSLSGGDEKYMQEQILEMIKLQYASLSQHTFIGSDTKSALATALPEGDNGYLRPYSKICKC